jgi:thiamine-monophosphate kinase
MTPKVKKTTERELLQSFDRIIAGRKTRTPGLVTGIGDDAAVLRPLPNQDLLVTTDVLVEGRHFERKWLTGLQLGWRLAAVNLSDIAAMGGTPRYALLSFAIPPAVETAYIEDVERGARDHLAHHRATVVGGNVSGIDGPLVCELTLIGACEKDKAWKRAGRPGKDAVVVVGRFGEARAGLDLLARRSRAKRFARLIRAYKRPKPLLDAVRLLAGEPALHGAIDVSDGFSTDVIHMCEAGGAGCEIDMRRFPLSKPLQSYCIAYGKVALEMALHGGEDYGLILAVDARKADDVATRIQRSLKLPARVVGRFTDRPGSYYLLGARGRRIPLRPQGWDHLTSPR